jgi:MFS family permease
LLTKNSIANYGVILYIQLGMTGYWPLLLTALWVLSTFPGNIFCAFFVERFGRRRFMLIGLSGILVSLICETAIQATYLGTTNRTALNFGVFFIFLVSEHRPELFSRDRWDFVY